FLMDLYTLRNLAIFGGGKTVVELEGTQELFLKMEQAELKEKSIGPPTDPYDRALTAGYLQAVLPLLQLAGEDLRSALLNLEAIIPEDSSGSFLRSGHSTVAGLFWTAIQSQVHRNQLLAALGVLRHRAETGRWPASLKEAGAVVLDPFNGRPLGWRQE